MRTFAVLLCVSLALTTNLALAETPAKNERQAGQETIKGYSDTPMQPETKWHIHDPNRPQPPVAEPKYDGKPVPAPAGASILFAGSNLDKWKNKNWPIKDHAMVAGKGGQHSLEEFGDVHLHVEWMVPEGLKGWGQHQGNSGVFLMNKYEIQVLNCWANRTYPDGMAGAMYGQYPPLVNACRQPGQWQSYDIHFKAPVFKEGKLVSPAYVTAYFNNVLIQDNQAFRGQTVWRRAAKYTPHGPKGSVHLQSHGAPVHYRNIWAAKLTKELGAKK
jgi:hypothetical protein